VDLGEKLFELRKAKNLTQDDVAEKLNVTRQTVSKWETNQSTPDFDKIVPLCKLYEITPNELLFAENQDNEDNEDKKHLFTRGKDENENYENMTLGQIKRKSAKVVSTSVFIYIVAIAFVTIAIPVQKMNPIVASSIFLVLIGWSTARIIKHYMSIPKIDKTEEEKKQDKMVKMITEIITCICVSIYFIISFITMAWHITWVIFIIMECINQIVKLIFMLKENEENEE
jgi:transcriptional regulator with XRE-family HTH domain